MVASLFNSIYQAVISLRAVLLLPFPWVERPNVFYPLFPGIGQIPIPLHLGRGQILVPLSPRERARVRADSCTQISRMSNVETYVTNRRGIV